MRKALQIVVQRLELKKRISDLSFLRAKEKESLELVGNLVSMRQSSVRWVLIKTKERLSKLVEEDQEKWFPHFVLVSLLEKNVTLRVLLE